VSEPPADILRRLRPIPTYADRPTTRPHDVEGIDPDGTACTIDVVEATEPVLLLFLSADCLGCRDLWDGLHVLHAGLAGLARLVVVTRSPGDEDAAAIAALAGEAAARLRIAVVMSTAAYRDYRVGGAPFLVVTDSSSVRTEGVAWGLEETLRAARAALPER
jgi:hypothetical protein